MDLPSRVFPLLACAALVCFASPAVAELPTISSNCTISNGAEDTDRSITHADLVAASSAADADSSPLVFRFKSSVNGTLKKGGVAVALNDTLAAGETWVWSPPANDNGLIDAFNVAAFAGGEESANNCLVRVDVAALNDAPSFTKGTNVTVLEDSGSYSANNWATNISPGPSNESTQTVSFTVTSDLAIFSAGPAISSNGRLTFTPSPNASGVATVSVKAVDDGSSGGANVNESAIQTFTITLTEINDAPSFTAGPVTVDEDSGPYTGTNWATGSPGPPSESDQTLTYVVTNVTNSTLFSTQPAVASNGTLTFTPAANENGTSTISVRVTDSGGTANGGVNQSAIQDFVITVNPVNDAPVLGGAVLGTSSSPLTDAFTGEEATVYSIFQNLTVTDADDAKPDNESLTVTVTVANSSASYGTFALPNSTSVVGSSNTVYTLANLRPSVAQTRLRAATFTPFANAVAVGDYTFNVKIEVRDSSSPTPLTATPIDGPVHFRSVNDSPEVTTYLTTTSMPDSGEIKPFRISVSDPDFGETFSVTVTETSATSRGTLVLPSDPITGNGAAVAAAMQNVIFRPFPQSSTQIATFQVSVTDVHPGSGTGTPVVASPDLQLTITFVNSPPEISGVTTELLRTTSDPAAPAVYPFSTVTITDANPGQSMTVTLALDDPGKGGFEGDFNQLGQITGTAAQVTTKLRSVIFRPASGRIPINQSETATVTIQVTDGLVSRTNSNTRIEVTSVNGAPSILWNVTLANPAGVFPLPTHPAQIAPLPVALPFDLVEIEDDGEVVVTVTMDNPAKGLLDNLAGFQELSPGSRSYRFTGMADDAEAAIQGLEFIPNGNYQFPPNEPGRTNFTITASDSALNLTSRLLPIVLENDSRTFLVTSLLDDVSVPGTLRHAVSFARNNDVITFALPSYLNPAVIRLNKTNGPLVLTKHLTFTGPGSDKLTISGDSNANGSTDSGDVQLFQIHAGVRMKGLRFARGFAATGGAISVSRPQPGQPAGSLVLEDCVIANCVASQWGGAIDVAEGSIRIERCLFENNSLNASSGLGGGALSLYTNAACSVINSTFSGNAQLASGGYGGGAIYVENLTSELLFNTDVSHCTFAGNIDASNRGSSISSNVANARVMLTNNIFADFSSRNLLVAGASEIRSNGGNLSNDFTSSSHIVNGTPGQTILLNHEDDQVNIDPRLAPLSTVEGQTRGHRLLPDSPAINAGVDGIAVIDQRGVIRNSTTDSGALDAEALGKLIIHEIFASQTSPDPQFIEFFNPRDQAAVDLGGYEVWIDGLKRHVFAPLQVVNPGFGIILADTLLTPASADTEVVLPSEAALSANLDLAPRGRIELRMPTPEGAMVVEAVSYVAVFANPGAPAASLDTDLDSITLVPQFQGAAFVPHGYMKPDGGFDLNHTGAKTSPGADTANQPFGAPNAQPVAIADRIDVTEDDLALLDVLSNDIDADGSDEQVIVDLNPAPANPVPATDNATTVSPGGAAVAIDPAGTPLRGTAVTFDPRTAFNHLPSGARVTDTFAYSIIDVGGGSVASYADGGSSSTVVSAPSHRMAQDDFVIIRDAGAAAYNGKHEIIAVTDDSFTIGVDYAGNPEPIARGSWQSDAPRTPSARSQALVEVTILGRNDPPEPVADAGAINEDTVLRIFGDPDLAGTGTVLDSDALYPQPRLFSDVALLANDDDPDTNDKPFTQLRVVGVCQASAIVGFSGTTGAAPLTVTAPAHGLQTGDTLLISGYGGHPSYNGNHVVTVTGPDTFTVPVTFVDDDPQKGLWTVLNDGNRLNTTSARGAAVTLEIRANRIQTNVVYNPRASSALNALADGESVIDTFYYAVEDTSGAVSLAPVSVDVAGVNDAPVPGNDPGGLAALDEWLTGGTTLPDVLGGSEVLYVLPGSAPGGGVRTAIRPPGGAFGDVVVISGLDHTDEDTALDFSSIALLANDADVDTSDVLSVELAGGALLSREGAAIRISGDGTTVTYDPTGADGLQALAYKERVIDTFTIVVFDGITRVESLVAVLVEGRNDQPVASPVALTTPEKDLLVVNPPGILLSGLEIDQNTNLPDNRKFLLPVEDFATTVFGAKVSVLLENRSGSIDAFAPVSGTPGVTAVVSPNHGLQTGEEVVILNSGELTGQYPATRIDDDTISVPVAFDPLFATIGGGSWRVLASTFEYDPTASVFSDTPDDPAFTLQGLAEGQTYVDTFTYTLLDGSFLFANDDIFRIEADRSNIELRVLVNDTNLDGLAGNRRIVEVGPSSAGGTVVMNGDQSLVYTPETGFVGDEFFVYTIEDDLGNRDSAMVTARVTVDRLNGNLRANADWFTVAHGQSPLLNVMANDSLIPATGNPLELVAVSSPPDQGGQAVIENGRIRYTPDITAVVPASGYLETFSYTMSGGGTATATATVTVLVLDRTNTLNVRADDFSVPVGSSEMVLNVLENDNILPGTGDTLEITSVTAPAHGTVTILNGVGLSYTPAAGFLGNDSFTYTASDGFGGTGTALVTVQVGYLVTNNDFFSVRFDSSSRTDDDGDTVLDVLANDGVLQGGAGQLTLTAVTPENPALGTMTVTPGGGSLGFNPATNATGQQDFTYTVVDGGGRSATGTVTVVVVSSGVRASSDAFTVQTDSQSNLLPVLANDLRISDLPGELSVASIGTGANGPDQGGTVEISADFKTIIYTAIPGFRGVESFTYTVTDGDFSDTARVSVRSTIGEMVAGDDAFFVYRGSSQGNRLAVLSNDRVIPDAGQLLFITAIGMDEANAGNPPHRGVLEVIEDGSALRYTPSPDSVTYPYEETFTYEISSGGTGRAEATIRIEVLDRVGARDLETNPDVFSVRSDSPGTLLPVLANDSVLPATAGNWILTDVTAPTANVCSPFLMSDFSDPAALAAHLEDQGDLITQYLWARFSPESQTLFANPSADPLDLRIALVAEFNAIAEGGVSIYDATRFAGVTLREQTQGLLDENPGGEQLIVLNRMLLEDALPAFINPAAAGGSVQIVGDDLLYVPQPGFVGAERFTYRVSDGLGGTGFAEVIVRVGDVSVSDDIFTVVAGAGPVDLPVLVNDGVHRNAFPAPWSPAQADFTLSPGMAITVVPPSAGTGVVAGSEVRFTPDPAFTGRAVLTYWVHDDSGCEFPGKAHIDVHAPGEDRDTAVASITVTGVNDPPQLRDAVATATDDKTSVRPFANATVIEYDDQRAQPVRLTITYPYEHGTLTGDFTEISPGVLEFYGTAAQITAALRALVFTPFIDRITVGTTENTGFVVSMDDGFVTTPVVVDSAVTVVTPVDDPPAITGTVAGQKLYQYSTLRPFAGVNITDVDDLALQPLTVSVRIDQAIKGNLSNLNGFVEQPSGSGWYVLTASPVQVSAALRDLVFTPTPGNRVTPSAPETVGFSISIDDAFLPPVLDTVTTVIVLHAEVDRVLPLGSVGEDVSQASAAFGTSVAISGDTMAVGSPQRDTPASDAGRVYVYERNAGFGAPWGQVAVIAGSDTVSGDRFGFAVAIDGDFMVVGAPGADPGTSNVGAAYVFRRDPANPNAWLQAVKLVPPVVNSGGGDAFGTAVAIHQGTILIGAPNANLSGGRVRSGRAFAFNLGTGGPSNWTHAQTILPLDNRHSTLSIDSEYFGSALALDGNTAVIGAYGANRAADYERWDYGAAYIFTRSAAGQPWSETKRLDEFESTSGKAYDGFGYSVDISGDRIAVGIHSTGSLLPAFNAGGARIFERNLGGANQWGLARSIVPSDGNLSEHFGSSIAVSGDLVMIGSPGATQGVSENRGFAEVYRYSSSSTPAWRRIDRLSPGVASATDRFGYSVAMDGFIGVAGAAHDAVNATNATNAGSARVYQFHYELDPRLTLQVPDQIARQDNLFGWTVDPETFDDPVYPGELVIDVRLAGGGPLPSGGWLSFDPLTGEFSGTPTESNRGAYDLVLVATNPLGAQVVSNEFQVSVAELVPVLDGLAGAYATWAAGEYDPDDINNPALEPSLWGMAANPDGDAYGNLLEMLFGTDPNASDPSQLTFERLSDTQVSLTFPLSSDFPESSLHVEWSTNLRDWSRDHVTMTQAPNAPGLVWVTAVVTTTEPQSNIFVRVVASP